MESSIRPAKPQVEPHDFYPGCCPVSEDPFPPVRQPTSYVLPDLPQQFVMGKFTFEIVGSLKHYHCGFKF